MGSDLRDIPGSPYYVAQSLQPKLDQIREKVQKLRSLGTLSPTALKRLAKYFRIKNIYNSNAIEGNSLDVGETRLVVEQGLTITGKPLKDTLEAKNLAHALDLFEGLADRRGEPILGIELRNLHAAVLRGINDAGAGKYRDERVEISGSPHKPPGPESVPGEMDALLAWLAMASSAEPSALANEDPLVLACAAHSWLVFIHPIVDGNGRVSRLLLNLLLMRFGYPIAVITKEDRLRYYDTLKDSDQGDLTSFCALVVECVEESLEEYQRAVDEQRESEEWAKSIVTKFTAKEETRLGHEFDVWKSAMEIMRSTFREKIAVLNEAASKTGQFACSYKQFGFLDFEQWLALRNFKSVKRAWAFGLSFRSGEKQERYVFFHGFADPAFRQYGENLVTLRLSHDESRSDYELVDRICRPDMPDLCEIGYSPKLEQFICRFRSGDCLPSKLDDAVKQLFTQIAQRQF